MEITVKITKEDMLDPKSLKELTTSILMFVKEMWLQSKDLAKQLQEENPEVQEAETETKAEAEYTLAYIRNFANKKASAITNGKAKVIDIIKKYSEKGISNIKESDYAAFIQDLEVLQ